MADLSVYRWCYHSASCRIIQVVPDVRRLHFDASHQITHSEIAERKEKMINHLDVLKVVHAGYSQQSGHTWGIEWFVKDLGEALVITFRGSDTARDWLRNFLAFPFRGRFAFTGPFGFV
jgi:hypothetical protein